MMRVDVRFNTNELQTTLVMNMYVQMNFGTDKLIRKLPQELAKTWQSNEKI